MFLYFFSLAIIAFEVICCKMFFESFCQASSSERKWQKVLLILLLISTYYVCGLTLSNWIGLKQLIAISVTAIIMLFYFRISIKSQ